MIIGIIGKGPESKDEIKDMQVMMAQRHMLASTTEFLADFYECVEILKSMDYTEEEATEIVNQAITNTKERFDKEVKDDIIPEIRKGIEMAKSDVGNLMQVLSGILGK